MFSGLFFKELKQILKCTTYYIIVICLVFFYITQLGEFDMIKKPVPNQESYGWTYSKDEKVIIDSTLKILIREYNANQYVTYPIGFYKEVTLSETKQAKVFDILLKVTGLSKEELQSALYAYRTTPLEQLNLTVADDISYDKFKELMQEVDKIIGGGSSYKKSTIESNALVPMTYEDALQEYDEIRVKDKLSAAYARLFCDYIGIVLAILPVFLAVTRGLRDKRAGAWEVIYSRRVSSFTVIMSRYLSMLVMLMLPTLLIAAYINLLCLYSGAGEGIAVDSLAFLKYSLGWLLPSVMVSDSVGLLLTELTESAIAILVMGAWWFISIFTGIINIRGGYGWNLIPRHNTLGNYQVFHDNFNILVANRIGYGILAILLALAAIFIYDLKRRGKLIIHGKKSANNKSES